MTSGPILEFGREVLHLPAELLDLLRWAAWSIVAGMWAFVLSAVVSVVLLAVTICRRRKP